MTPDAGPTTPGWLRWLGLSERRASVLILILVAVFMVLAYVLRDRVPGVETLGYPAVFLVSLIGSATLLFPVPAILAVCTGGILLNPLLVGVTGGVGQALGEMTGYLAGIGGQGLITKNRLYARVQPVMQKRGWIAVFVFALIPNPLFDFIDRRSNSMIEFLRVSQTSHSTDPAKEKWRPCRDFDRVAISPRYQ